jgi:CarboxypepD_reg-like domain
MFTKKQIIFIFILLIISTSLFAQLTITGKVINVKTTEPIAGANVFINSTSYKTVTNAEGEFKFLDLNLQKGELVVNAMGYKHILISIDNKKKNLITVKLESQPKELDTVLVKTYDKDGYNKWGRFFTGVFIGHTQEAMDCKIANTKALKFYYDKKLNQLSVDATEPLKIVNKALGYEIDYTLETFEYNTKSDHLLFAGYPVFTEMQKGKKKMRKWKEVRNNCYRGSVMHFMRALYRNKLTEEGFTVQKVNKILNEKKAAYMNELKRIMLEQKNGNFVLTMPTNGDNENLMRQPDSLFQIISQILPSDSFAFAVDSLTAGMYFKNHLLVCYKKQDLHTTVSSFIKLLNDENLVIFQNGLFYNTKIFFTEKYWAENEKISKLLPYDFVYNANLDD